MEGAIEFPVNPHFVNEWTGGDLIYVTITTPIMDGEDVIAVVDYQVKVC